MLTALAILAGVVSGAAFVFMLVLWLGSKLDQTRPVMVHVVEVEVAPMPEPIVVPDMEAPRATRH